jgi:hypothetical protein
MRTDTFLRALGETLSKAMRRAGVPLTLVDGWQTQWALVVADIEEDGHQVEDTVLSIVQAMTHARELVRVYGRE